MKKSPFEEASKTLQKLLTRKLVPLMREDLDFAFNGHPLLGTRKEIIDISKLSDEEITALWYAGENLDDDLSG